jgi:hypothetical protein
MKTKVFVDSDTLLYSAAAVVEKRAIKVLHLPSGSRREFSNRTELKKVLKDNGKELNENFIIEDVQYPEPIENCLHLVKSSVSNILNLYDFDEITFIAGDEDNFRLNLPLPTRYKDSRKDTLRPVHLKEAHSYLRNKYKAIKAIGFEADDLVTILANKAIKEGNTAVILSADKDKRQSIGVHIGEYHYSLAETVLVKEMHPVELQDGDFKSYGIPWIAYQLLCGDSSDGYKPTKLCSAKYGDVSAYNDLKDCHSPQDVLSLIIRKYKEWYPDKFEYTDWSCTQHEADWKSMLQLYYSCARMKRSYDDDLNIQAFFDEYKVDLK